jgi:two-component system, NarL family, sensor kinase
MILFVALVVNNYVTMKGVHVVVFCIVLTGRLLLNPQADLQAQASLEQRINTLLQQGETSWPTSPNDSVKLYRLIKHANDVMERSQDSAFLWLDRALDSALAEGWWQPVSAILERKAIAYIHAGKYEQAAICAYQALRIEEHLGNKTRMASCNDLLGLIWYYQEVFAKSLWYHQQALKLYKNQKHLNGQAEVLSHLGSLYNAREFCEKRVQDDYFADIRTSLGYFMQSLELYIELQDPEGVALSWLNIGNAYRRLGQPTKATPWFEKALTHYRISGNAIRMAQTLRTMGLNFNSLGRHINALEYLKESEALMLNNDKTGAIQYLYEEIAETYDLLLDYRNARDYYIKYMIVKDSVQSKERSDQIIDLETRYQIGKKQHEIERLTHIKQRRNILIYTLAGLLIAITAISLAWIRNHRQRSIIAEQKLQLHQRLIIEAEQERQLLAARSVIQGEESERGRIARDLHDGLGGILTGIRLKLFALKESSGLGEKLHKLLNQALTLTDSSLTEMRRIAYNLMPETLLHYGLQTALSDFIRQIEPGGGQPLHLSVFGEPMRYAIDLEISAYRISQELINNALKHSYASHVHVQLYTEPERICVQVIDNGIGFLPEESGKSGNGLRNIRDRISLYNGRLEIVSDPGTGTECTLEFMLSDNNQKPL